MKRSDINRLQVVAAMFKDNEELILKKWISSVRKARLARDEMEFSLFETGFRSLLKDFVLCLSTGDFDGYFARNATIAQQIAFNDVSYRRFVEAFHYFEDSYLDYLGEYVPQDDVLSYIKTIDKLHHETIAIVSEEYFKVTEHTVFALAKLAELRDPETGFHLERTREYSVVLAKALKTEEDFAAQIYRVGPLHDIGKIAIKDSILRKPGELSLEEFEEMKKHTVIGGDAISNIIGNQEVNRGYLMMAIEIALYHHERFDGSGYPEGLLKENIPLSARVFAIADAYDAIVSQRPYKKALPHSEAVERIRKDSGTHFDPEIVKVFLEVHHKFDQIRKRYQR